MSLRKQYQEKFGLDPDKKKIQELNFQTEETFILFEELRDEILRQQPIISTIEDSIIKSKINVQSGGREVEVSGEENYMFYKTKSLLYAMIGGGLGSVALIYSPYIGIGAITGGIICGGIVSLIGKS